MKLNYLEVVILGRLLDAPNGEKMNVTALTKRINIANAIKREEVLDKIMEGMSIDEMKKAIVDVKLRESQVKYLCSLYDRMDWGEINGNKVTIDKNYADAIIALYDRLKKALPKDEEEEK